MRRAVLLGGPGVEGGINGPGEAASTWQQAEALGRVTPSGLGIDLLDDPAALLDPLGKLGVDEVFLRIAWPKIEPKEGAIDDEALRRYGALVAELRGAARSVHLVLSDGTAPAWFGVEGWLMPSAPDRFAPYVSAVLERLADGIDGVVSLEEPADWVMAGWLSGSAPPFRRFALPDAIAALDTMLACHRVAEGIVAGWPRIEHTLLSSSGIPGDVESRLLGRVTRRRLPGPLLGAIDRWSPGRALRDRDEADASQRLLAVGRGVVPPGMLAGELWSLAGHDETGSIAAALSAEGQALSISHRHVVARLNERGRRLPGRPPQRVIELGQILAEIDQAPEGRCHRLFLGELVDRWRYGTTSSCEGLLGVDRSRGRRGFRLLSTDQSGANSIAEIAELLRISTRPSAS